MFVHAEDIPKARCSKCGQINLWPIRYWKGNDEITECKHCDHKVISARLTIAGDDEHINIYSKSQKERVF